MYGNWRIRFRSIKPDQVTVTEILDGMVFRKDPLLFHSYLIFIFSQRKCLIIMVFFANSLTYHQLAVLQLFFKQPITRCQIRAVRLFIMFSKRAKQRKWCALYPPTHFLIKKKICFEDFEWLLSGLCPDSKANRSAASDPRGRKRRAHSCRHFTVPTYKWHLCFDTIF